MYILFQAWTQNKLMTGFGMYKCYIALHEMFHVYTGAGDMWGSCRLGSYTFHKVSDIILII